MNSKPPALPGVFDYKGSLKLYRKSYHILRKYLGVHNLEVIRAYSWTGINLFYLGDYTRAIKILQKTLPDFIKLFGNDYIEVIHVRSYMGSILYCQGKYDEALLIFEKTTIAKENFYGTENESSIWEYIWLARTMEKTGRKTEAIKYFEKSSDNYKRNAKITISTRYSMCSPFIDFLWRNKKYNKMIQHVESCVSVSNVIITKGNKIAMAVYYDRKTMYCPKITIMGKNILAQSIIEIAKSKKIPIVEDKKLSMDIIKKYGPGYIAEEYWENVINILVKIHYKTR
jgi:tetratricopeptide (TPR) repeat protein